MFLRWVWRTSFLLHFLGHRGHWMTGWTPHSKSMWLSTSCLPTYFLPHLRHRNRPSSVGITKKKFLSVWFIFFFELQVELNQNSIPMEVFKVVLFHWTFNGGKRCVWVYAFWGRASSWPRTDRCRTWIEVPLRTQTVCDCRGRESVCTFCHTCRTQISIRPYLKQTSKSGKSPTSNLR